MYNTTNCSTNVGNTGAQNFCGPVGKDRIVILVPKGTEIATETLAVTLATWQDNINEGKSTRWFPLIPIVNGEATQEDPVLQEFDFGYSDHVYIPVLYPAFHPKHTTARDVIQCMHDLKVYAQVSGSAGYIGVPLQDERTNFTNEIMSKLGLKRMHRELFSI